MFSGVMTPESPGSTPLYVRYGFILVCYSNFVREIFDFKNAVTFKTELRICESHWKCHNSIENLRLPIDDL